MDVRCGDSAALAGYLYEESDPAERAAVERHLSMCASCAEEIAALRGTRQLLTAWTPPDASLGFRLVASNVASDVTSDAASDVADETRAPRAAEPSGRWWQWSMFPAWAQAAAAVMLFAGGALVAALMNMEVRYDQAGVSIRTGWQQAATSLDDRGADAAAPGATSVSRSDLAALESRIRQDFTRTRAEEAGQGVSAASAASNGDLLQRMREMIAASEARQERELALRVAQVMRDTDSTRRADMARIERTVSPLEGVTTEELLQQRQMLNYLIRVSEQK